MVFVSMVEFFSGAIIPIPFFLDGIRTVLELLPFASMQNVPLRIYSGDLSGTLMHKAILIQLIWLLILILASKFLNVLAMKRVTIQGG